MTADKQLFLTSQKDENILIPTPEDYYEVGTVVKIKQMLKIKVTRCGCWWKASIAR